MEVGADFPLCCGMHRDSDGRLCGEEQDGWTRECPELNKEQKARR